MKKIALLLFLLLAIQPALKAQLELGVDLSPATTWMINQNVSDRGENFNYHTSFGFSGGLHGGFFFTDKIGVAAELNMSWFNQKYAGYGVVFEQPGSDTLRYDIVDHLKYISIPVLFELKTSGGFYFELGPQFNFLLSAKEDYTANIDALSGSGRDIKTGISSLMIGGTLGFGGRFQLARNLMMTAGLRLFGSFSDATTELSQGEFAQEGVNDKLGIAAYYAHTNQYGDFSYQKTLAVSGRVVVCVIYTLGSERKK